MFNSLRSLLLQPCISAALPRQHSKCKLHEDPSHTHTECHTAYSRTAIFLKSRGITTTNYCWIKLHPALLSCFLWYLTTEPREECKNRPCSYVACNYDTLLMIPHAPALCRSGIFSTRYCILRFKSTQWIFLALVILMPSKPQTLLFTIDSYNAFIQFVLSSFSRLTVWGFFDHT